MNGVPQVNAGLRISAVVWPGVLTGRQAGDVLPALESPSFVVFGLRGYVSQAEDPASRLRPLTRGAGQEPSGGRGCPGPAGAAPPAPALGPLLRPLLPFSAVWHPRGREASSSADSLRAAEGGQSADACRWAGPDRCVGGGLHYFPLGPRSRGGRGQTRPSQPRTARAARRAGSGRGRGGGAAPRAWDRARGGGPRDSPGGLSHAPRPAPPFLPSFLPSALPGAFGRRPSFVGARGPSASLGRPNFASPGRLPSGTCEAWPGGGGACGGVGLPGRREARSESHWTMSWAAPRCGHF